MSLYDNELLRGGNNYDDDDFFDEDHQPDDDSSDEDSFDDDDFFGGARKKKSNSRKSASPKKSADASSKHSFSVAHVEIGSYEGGHFVSSTATNAAKKAATAIFRHIDLQSGAAKPGKNAKTDVKVDAGLKAKYGKKPITGVAVHFILFRNERKSLSKYYAYVAKRTKLTSAAKGPVDKDGKQVKYEYKVELKKSDLPAKYQTLNEQHKKDNNAKKAKKAAAEKKAANPKPKKATAPKKATGAKKAAAPKKVVAKKVKGTTLNDIIKALSGTAPKPKKATAAKKAAAPKKTSPKRAASPKPKKSPAKKASPKPKKAAAPKKAAMKGGSGFCSFF